MRKLASVQLIRDVQPIPNAESIDVARVLGWSVVIKKGEFQVGDKVIYVEIDSLLPEREEFEFLRKDGFRIRTVRLRSQVSQGICFSMELLPEGSYEEGADVTELLGIEKYEPPIPPILQGTIVGKYPSFIPKTTENRIQSEVFNLSVWKGKEGVALEKLDGTSSTFYLQDGHFGVCGKTIEYLDSENNLYWRMARLYKVEETLRSLGRDLAIQGEIIGSGITKNKYKLNNEHRFYAFNILDVSTGEYLDDVTFNELMKEFHFQSVPIVSNSMIIHEDMEAYVELSNGKSAINPSILREGIVIKSKNEGKHGLGSFSFKVINPNFLIKHKE